MEMKIYTNGEIQIDGRPSGLYVTSAHKDTIVYSLAPYREHKLPSKRYSLVHETPDSGVPGREEFAQHILDLLRKL